MPTGPRPPSPEDALCWFYHQGIETDSRLSVKAVLLLGWMACLAAQDQAPLPYSIFELNRKFEWSVADLRKAAACAWAAGFVEINKDMLTLVDPRERKAA